MAGPTHPLSAPDHQRGPPDPASEGGGMTTERLHFSTEMLSRLGEELNPHTDQGILELVRNAYDADATKCVVELINAHRSGGGVRVSDDGDGMTADDIRDGWLVL